MTEKASVISDDRFQNCSKAKPFETVSSCVRR